MSISKQWCVALAMIVGLWLPAGPTLAQEQTRIRGTIESLDGTNLTVKTREGPIGADRPGAGLEGLGAGPRRSCRDHARHLHRHRRRAAAGRHAGRRSKC